MPLLSGSLDGSALSLTQEVPYHSHRKLLNIKKAKNVLATRPPGAKLGHNQLSNWCHWHGCKNSRVAHSHYPHSSCKETFLLLQAPTSSTPGSKHSTVSPIKLFVQLSMSRWHLKGHSPAIVLYEKFHPSPFVLQPCQA